MSALDVGVAIVMWPFQLGYCVVSFGLFRLSELISKKIWFKVPLLIVEMGASAYYFNTFYYTGGHASQAALLMYFPLIAFSAVLLVINPIRILKSVATAILRAG